MIYTCFLKGGINDTASVFTVLPPGQCLGSDLCYYGVVRFVQKEYFMAPWNIFKKPTLLSLSKTCG